MTSIWCLRQQYKNTVVERNSKVVKNCFYQTHKHKAVLLRGGAERVNDE